jgi:hypothetical protein
MGYAVRSLTVGLAWLCLVVPMTAGSGGVHRCEDAHGKITYQSRPCPPVGQVGGGTGSDRRNASDASSGLTPQTVLRLIEAFDQATMAGDFRKVLSALADIADLDVPDPFATGGEATVTDKDAYARLLAEVYGMAERLVVERTNERVAILDGGKAAIYSGDANRQFLFRDNRLQIRSRDRAKVELFAGRPLITIWISKVFDMRGLDGARAAWQARARSR